MDRIVVNNEDLDLFEGTNINLNIQLATIADISTRNSTFSNSASIPRTAKNERIFELVGTMGNNSRMPYKRVVCDYLHDNITIIRQGYLYITKTSKDRYMVNLFDGIVNFQEKLGDKTLRDLDYSEMNHYFTKDNYKGSFTNNSGFIYAVADFGNSIKDRDYIQIANQAPSIFAFELWNKIFGEAGIGFVGDFFTTNTKWKSYVVTPSQGFKAEASDVTETTSGVIKTTGYDNTSPTNLIQYFHNGFGGYVYTDTIEIVHNGTLSGGNFSKSGSEITVNFTGTAKIAWDFHFQNHFTSLGIVVIEVNGVSKYVLQLPEWDASEVDTEWIKTDIFFQSNLNSGDKIKFKIYASSKKDGPAQRLELYYASKIELFKVTTSGPSYFVDMKDLVSDMKQSDFVKDMMQHYGLLMRPTDYQKTSYEFIQIKDLLSDRENAVDYTEKVINIGDESYDSGYAITNNANYNYPNELALHNYNGTIQLDNEVLPISKDMMKSGFEIPIKTDSYGGREIYRVPVWSDKLNSNDIAYETKTEKAKLMSLVKSADPFNFKYFLESTETISGLIPSLNLQDVDYQYFIDHYYEEFGQMLNNYKEIEVEMNLNAIEIQQIDLFKLVFLKHTGRYYYIDSVQVNKTVKMKLIEVNLTY